MPTYVLLIKKFLWFVPHVVVCDLRDVTENRHVLEK